MNAPADLLPLTPPPRRFGGKRVLLVMLTIVGVAAIPAIVLPFVGPHRHATELKDLGTITPFALTDERGLPFTEAALRGHPTVVSFIFTRCDTICPVTSMKMARIQDQTSDVGARIKLLSISVDPTYDTPARLAEYATHYRADPERWRFITGPADKIHDLVEGAFMTSMLREADRPGGIPNIAHGGYFMLVDGNLHLRGMYSSSDVARLEELIRDARYLAKSAP